MTVQYKIIALLVSLLLVVGAVTGAYFKGYENGKAEAQKDCEIATQKAVGEANSKVDAANTKISEISKQLEEKKQKQQQNKGKTDASIDKEIASNPVYSTSVVPDTGVRHAASTAASLNSIRHSGKPADQVP